MRGLKEGDLVMVRDIKSGFNLWDYWCKGKVIKCHRHPDGKFDVLEIGFRVDGTFYKVLTSRYGGIAVPYDDDVATVLTFGEKAVGFLRDFRI